MRQLQVRPSHPAKIYILNQIICRLITQIKILRRCLIQGPHHAHPTPFSIQGYPGPLPERLDIGPRNFSKLVIAVEENRKKLPAYY